MATTAQERIAELEERLEQLDQRVSFGGAPSQDAMLIANAIRRAGDDMALGLARVEKQLESLLGAPALAGE